MKKEKFILPICSQLLIAIPLFSVFVFYAQIPFLQLFRKKKIRKCLFQNFYFNSIFIYFNPIAFSLFLFTLHVDSQTSLCFFTVFFLQKTCNFGILKQIISNYHICHFYLSKIQRKKFFSKEDF